MKQSLFSEKTLTLSVLVSVFAQGILSMGTVPAREMLLQGFPMALGVSLLSFLVTESGWETGGKKFCGKLICGGLALWFGWELADTLRQAQTICWTQFSSMAVLGLLPLLLWAGWVLEPEVLSRSAQILCRAAALTGFLFLLSLFGQLRWENLMTELVCGTTEISLYPEYFSAPFLCAAKRRAGGSWLPVKAFFLSAGILLGRALLFGSDAGIEGVELLRTGTLGSISRFDSVVLLVWLAAALFRVCFLVQAERQLLRQICRQEPMGEFE